MTQMQSPYQDQSDVSLYQEPDRTSIMAILSLVFGVGGCCLGITSIPAILLGIFGLVGITRSKGRIGGTGFSIAGILVGLITLALWGGVLGATVFGLKSMEGTFGSTTEQIFLDIQAGNLDAARSKMDSPASDATDADLIAFREGYQNGLGEFVSKTEGLGDLISGYIAVGELIQPYNGRPGYVPLPMRFDSGYGLVIYVINQQSNGQGFPNAIQYIVIDLDGNEYHLPWNGTTNVNPELPSADDVDVETDDDAPSTDDGP
ncbi:MAG: DUF4190 domain-containing protein [Phycisphaerales bacterium]|nr:DUF4190 domain-containing protein [Phycisphaerales bacterium]